MDTNSMDFGKSQSVDYETQQLIAALNAADEIGSSQGSQGSQRRKRRLISVVDEDDGYDVEILPTRATQPWKKSSFGKSTTQNSKKPMIQSTLHIGIGSASQTQSRKSTQSVKDTNDGGRNACKTQHKKQKTQDDQTEVEDESEHDEPENQLKETRQWSDVWKDFFVVRKENGVEKAVCNHCKNEYAWSSHSHGTTGLRRHRDKCSKYPRNLRNMIITADAKIQARKYDHDVFRQLVAKTII